MNVLDNMAVGAQVYMWKCKEKIKDFFAEEHGVSNVVATVILVLVVVLLIAAFWGSLKTWMAQLWKKITEGSNGITGTPNLESGGATGGGVN